VASDPIPRALPQPCAPGRPVAIPRGNSRPATPILTPGARSWASPLLPLARGHEDLPLVNNPG